MLYSDFIFFEQGWPGLCALFQRASCQ